MSQWDINVIFFNWDKSFEQKFVLWIFCYLSFINIFFLNKRLQTKRLTKHNYTHSFVLIVIYKYRVSKVANYNYEYVFLVLDGDCGISVVQFTMSKPSYGLKFSFVTSRIVPLSQSTRITKYQHCIAIRENTQFITISNTMW